MIWVSLVTTRRSKCLLWILNILVVLRFTSDSLYPRPSLVIRGSDLLAFHNLLHCINISSSLQFADCVPPWTATSQRPKLLWCYFPQLRQVVSFIYFSNWMGRSKELPHSLPYSDLPDNSLHQTSQFAILSASGEMRVSLGFIPLSPAIFLCTEPSFPLAFRLLISPVNHDNCRLLPPSVILCIHTGLHLTV